MSFPNPCPIPVRRVRAAHWRGLLVAFAAVLPGLAQAGTVAGQVFDGNGRPLPKSAVLLLERTGGGLFSRNTIAVSELARTETDANGFFTFDLGARSIKGHVLVRCYDPGTWDDRRYTRPDDRDVTDALEDHGRAVVACRVEDAPGWVELQREIERVGGPESDRGRVLRRLGLPPEVVTGKDGQVEWRYRGVLYVFKDGSLVDTRKDAAPGTAPAMDTARTGGER